MNRFEIAKDAFRQIVEAIVELENKLNITCSLPEFVEVDGKLFFSEELKNFRLKRDETGKIRIFEND